MMNFLLRSKVSAYTTHRDRFGHVCRSSSRLAYNPKRFEEEDAYTKEYMDEIAAALNITRYEQWYNVSIAQIGSKISLSTINRRYQGSLYAALLDNYPDFEWQAWKFAFQPKTFWDDEANQLQFLLWMAEDLQLKSPEAWANIVTATVNHCGGGALLKRYQDSLVKTLVSIFPEYLWQVWAFPVCNKEFWDSKENCKQYLDWVGDHLKIQSPQDWQQVTATTLGELGGRNLLKKYHNSVPELLRRVYTDMEMRPWLVNKEMVWNQQWVQSAFIEWAAEQMKLKTISDWYKVTALDVKELGGASLLELYDNSLVKLLEHMYPDFRWYPWLFEKVPVGYWDVSRNVKNYVIWLCEQLCIENPHQVSSITRTQMMDHHGLGILAKWPSVRKVMEVAFPLWNWHPWLFPNYQQSMWEDEEIWPVFLMWFAEVNKIDNPEKWYLYSIHDFEKYTGLMKGTFGGFIFYVLEHFYPDYQWHSWLFGKVPYGFWDNLKNIRSYVKWLEEQLGVKTPDDWYGIKGSDLRNLKGRFVVSENFGGSLIKTLETVYPNIKWQAWRFDRATHGFWENPANVDEYVEWLADKLEVNCIEDVYYVTTDEVIALGGQTVLARVGGLIPLLSKCFPQYELEDSNRRLQKSQKILLKTVETILCTRGDSTEILYNFKHPVLGFQDSSKVIELDIFVPALGMALEYQGEHHFGFHYQSGPGSVRESRDSLKMEACRRENIVLVHIPFWWDRQKESLIATIENQRPGTFSALEASFEPIPEKAPPKVRNKGFRRQPNLARLLQPT